MVDEFEFTSPTIIIADRGYESFNVYEHIKKSGQKFLIRAKDTKSNGLLNGLDLPSDGTFDKKIPLQLIRRQTKKVKKIDIIISYIKERILIIFLSVLKKHTRSVSESFELS